jgi:hypothetical protein
MHSLIRNSRFHFASIFRRSALNTGLEPSQERESYLPNFIEQIINGRASLILDYFDQVSESISTTHSLYKLYRQA